MKYNGSRCYYCGVVFGQMGDNSVKTLDHIVPTSKGGSKTGDNVVSACYLCNHHKSDNELSEFEDSEWLFKRRCSVIRHELNVIKKATTFTHTDLTFDITGWHCNDCYNSGAHGESPTLVRCKI